MYTMCIICSIFHHVFYLRAKSRVSNLRSRRGSGPRDGGRGGSRGGGGRGSHRGGGGIRSASQGSEICCCFRPILLKVAEKFQHQVIFLSDKNKYQPFTLISLFFPRIS